MYIASEMNVQAGLNTVYSILTKGILTGSYFKKQKCIFITYIPGARGIQ